MQWKDAKLRGLVIQGIGQGIYLEFRNTKYARYRFGKFQPRPTDPSMEAITASITTHQAF